MLNKTQAIAAMARGLFVTRASNPDVIFLGGVGHTGEFVIKAFSRETQPEPVDFESYQGNTNWMLSPGQEHQFHAPAPLHPYPTPVPQDEPIGTCATNEPVNTVLAEREQEYYRRCRAFELATEFRRVEIPGDKPMDLEETVKAAKKIEAYLRDGKAD